MRSGRKFWLTGQASWQRRPRGWWERRLSPKRRWTPRWRRCWIARHKLAYLPPVGVVNGKDGLTAERSVEESGEYVLYVKNTGKTSVGFSISYLVR